MQDLLDDEPGGVAEPQARQPSPTRRHVRRSVGRRRAARRQQVAATNAAAQRPVFESQLAGPSSRPPNRRASIADQGCGYRDECPEQEGAGGLGPGHPPFVGIRPRQLPANRPNRSRPLGAIPAVRGTSRGFTIRRRQSRAGRPDPTKSGGDRGGVVADMGGEVLGDPRPRRPATSAAASRLPPRSRRDAGRGDRSGTTHDRSGQPPRCGRGAARAASLMTIASASSNGRSRCSGSL